MPVTKKKRVAASSKPQGKKGSSSELWIDNNGIDGLRAKRGGRSICHLNDFDDLGYNGNNNEYCSTTEGSSSSSSGGCLFSSSSSSSTGEKEVVDARKLSGKNPETKQKKDGRRAPSQCGRNDSSSDQVYRGMEGIGTEKINAANGKLEESCDGVFRIVDEEARRKRRQQVAKQQPSDPPKKLSRRMSYKIHRHTSALSPAISPIQAVTLSFTPKVETVVEEKMPKPNEFPQDQKPAANPKRKRPNKKAAVQIGKKGGTKKQARQSAKIKVKTQSKTKN